MDDYFPLKLALGDKFCNREKERQQLNANVAKCRHTVLVSPRRYGKSSLVYKVASELKIPLATADLFLVHDDKTITNRILQAIAEAVSQIVPAKAKFIDLVQKTFQNFKITLGIESFNIEVSYNAAAFDTADQILTSLQNLAKLARTKNTRILFFIDEFQDITHVNNAKSIQGALRHFAQESTNIVFFFAGSNRHLMLELFDEKSKPLYMLCDKLNLQRISSKDYWAHLQKAATKKWGIKLSPLAFEKIMQYTELHPLYVNMLCNELWSAPNAPEINDILNAWDMCFEKEERRIISELEKLTTNQQQLLKALALKPAIEPTGQKFLTAAKLPYSSLRQTLIALNDKDMIYKVTEEDPAIPGLKQGQIRVLDPLLAYALRKYQ